MRIKYKAYLEQLELDFGIKPTHVEISNILGGKPNANSLSNRLYNDGFLKQDERMILDSHFYKKEIDENLILTVRQKSDVFAIPYWEGYCECAEKLKRDDFTDLKLDVELIKSWNAKPENLCIIAMPGDDMDGGDFPIKNKDLLIIDTSRNDTYESGIFFATSHGCTRVYVRRIFEQNSKEKSYYTSIDNPIYKSVIDKIWTEQQWKEADIKIIGRVITNATYTI